MLVTIIKPILLTFVLGCLLGPIVIPFMRRLKANQTERKELESHLKKNGTPTMGGFIFIIAISVVCCFYIPSQPKILPIYLMFMAFAAIGFIDDFLKVVLKRSDGLKAKQKLILQFIVSTVFAIYMQLYSGIGLALRIPFLHNHMIHIGILAIPLLYIVTIGTTNGTNLTDGVDGLLSTVTLPVAIFLSVASIERKSGIESFSFMVIGGLLAFLIFNSYKAEIFMGDTGSLAIGGYVVASAYLMNMPIFIVLFGMIYLVEALSVMIQVAYFKKTKGKRIFRMAPIHHHFELGGWSETKVVAIFSIVTTILCMIAALAL